MKNLASELAIELKHPATIKQERIVLTRTDLPELLRSKRSPLAVEFRPFKKRTKINVIVKGRNTKICTRNTSKASNKPTNTGLT